MTDRPQTLKGDPWAVVDLLPLERLIQPDDQIEPDNLVAQDVADLRVRMPELKSVPDATLRCLWDSFSSYWMLVGCYGQRTDEFVIYMVAVIVGDEREIRITCPASISAHLILNRMFDGATFPDAFSEMQ